MRRVWVPMLAIGAVAASCQPSVRVEPIRIEPIQITMDINVRVDKQLDQFFDFEQSAGVPSTNAPASGGK